MATLDGMPLDVPLLSPELIIRDSTTTMQESS